MKTLTLIIAVLLLTRCSDDEHDGKIVKDAEGNYYRLDHRVGVVYALDEISGLEIEKLDGRLRDITYIYDSITFIMYRDSIILKCP